MKLFPGRDERCDYLRISPKGFNKRRKEREREREGRDALFFREDEREREKETSFLKKKKKKKKKKTCRRRHELVLWIDRISLPIRPEVTARRSRRSRPRRENVWTVENVLGEIARNRRTGDDIHVRN